MASEATEATTARTDNDWLNAAILTVLSAVLLLPGLSRFGLWDPYEIRIADLAQQMMERAPNWAQLGRPPLPLLIVARGFKTFGVGELGGRLPMAVLAILAVLATYWAAIARFSRRAALIAAATIITAPVFVLGSRQLVSNAPQLLAAALTLGGCVHVAWNPRMGAKIAGVLLGVVGMAMGVFSMGAICAVAAPLLAIAIALGVERRVVPAIVAAVLALGAIVPTVLAAQNTGSFSLWLGGTPHAAAHAIVITTHVKTLGFGMFPWILLYPFGIAVALFAGDSRGLPFALWSVTLFLAGTFHAAILGDFLVPLAPVIAIVVAAAIEWMLDTHERLPYVAAAILFGAILIGRDFATGPELYVGAHLTESIRWPGPLTAVPYALLAYALAWGVCLALALGVPLAPASHGEGARQRNRFVALAAALVVAFGMAMGTAHAIVPQVSLHLSSKAIYGKSRELDPNAPLGYYRFNAQGASYYAKDRAATQLGSIEQLFEFLGKNQRVLVFAGADELPAIEQQSRNIKKPYFVIDDTNSRFLVLSNQLKGNEKDMNPLKLFISDSEPKPGHVVHATFEDKIELLGYDVPASVHRGEDFKIRLYFKTLAPVGGNYKVFIHFDGAGSRVNGDHVPLEGRFPTQHWAAGTYITDEHLVRPDRAMQPSGAYTLFMGFFSGDKRMQVSAGPHEADHRVKLGPMNVQ